MLSLDSSSTEAAAVPWSPYLLRLHLIEETKTKITALVRGNCRHDAHHLQLSRRERNRTDRCLPTCFEPSQHHILTPEQYFALPPLPSGCTLHVATLHAIENPMQERYFSGCCLTRSRSVPCTYERSYACHQAASMKGSKSSLWASMKSTQRSRICASDVLSVPTCTAHACTTSLFCCSGFEVHLLVAYTSHTSTRSRRNHARHRDAREHGVHILAHGPIAMEDCPHHAKVCAGKQAHDRLSLKVKLHERQVRLQPTGRQTSADGLPWGTRLNATVSQGNMGQALQKATAQELP